MIFVDDTEFANMQEAGKFLESDFHAGYWYGTQKEPVESLLHGGKNVILRLDVNGALSIKKLMPTAVIIIIVPESMDVLEQRIRNRQTDSEETIKDRLELAKQEINKKDEFDHCVVNPTGAPKKALAEIETLVGLNSQ